MGGGTPREGLRRPTTGGMAGTGPVIRCPGAGALEATPGGLARRGIVGILSASGSRVTMVRADGSIVATAVPSPESELVAHCLEDGFTFSATMEEQSGTWTIRYQETYTRAAN